jgi:hypothetical protein
MGHHFLSTDSGGDDRFGDPASGELTGTIVRAHVASQRKFCQILFSMRQNLSEFKKLSIMK